MPTFDEKHVKVENCYLIWDAITRPEQNESGQKWCLKLAVHPSNPDAALLEQLCNKTLQESEFKGHLPNGGTMPLGMLGPNEAGGLFNGWKVFNAGTYRGCPDIYVDNQRVDLMQAGNLLYGGQVVDALVHAYVNNKKVKGIALGLDGFNIKASANAQRLNIGGGLSVDTSKAFGGGAPAAAPVAQQQQPAYQQPAAQPMQAPGYAAAAAPAGYPQQAPAGMTVPATGYPQQAHNFLPGQ